VIHPSAQVHPSARLAPDVEVGAFAIIEAGATLGAGCQIAAHAIVKARAELGAGVRVDHFAVVGGDPQDLSFDPTTDSGTYVGDRTVIRESATIHAATADGDVTRVGSDCLIMAYAHVAHDCQVGNRVIMANVATVEAKNGILNKEINAVGIVQYDQSRQAKVTAWIAGRIDKLNVSTWEPMSARTGR
jgi:UDP-N-acetylglucosamine acyltransferase